MSDHLPMLEREIHALLEPPAGVPPTRETVERTLTTGYAHALRLDGDRLRAESRLRTLVRSGAARRDLLSEAGVELERVEGELVRLRALLARLRARAL